MIMEPWRPPPVNIVTPTGWDESPQASDTKPKRHRPTTPTSPPTTMLQWVAFDTTMLDVWITCYAEVVASLLEDIRRGNSAQHPHKLVGLDTEWKRFPGGDVTTAILQLCVGTSVLVFQVLYANGGDLPKVMKRFLTKEDHIFTSAHIENDVKRLRDDFSITITNPIDLQLVVPEAAAEYKHLGGPYPEYGVRRSSLEKIALEVLCQPHLLKPAGADHDHWHERYLDSFQVRYNAIDAYLSYEIVNQLELKHGCRFA